MTGVRAPVRAALWRGREVLGGLALAVAGGAVAWASFGVTRGVAGVLAMAGLALVWTGAQRLRFGEGGGGPGVVTVDERRLVYWGPLSGGVMDMDALARLDIDPSGRPAHWVLTGLRGDRLAVPVDARGAEALFDLFAALPGLSSEALVAARARAGGPPETLWQAPDVVALPGRGPRRLS